MGLRLIVMIVLTIVCVMVGSLIVDMVAECCKGWKKIVWDAVFYICNTLLVFSVAFLGLITFWVS